MDPYLYDYDSIRAMAKPNDFSVVLRHPSPIDNLSAEGSSPYDRLDARSSISFGMTNRVPAGPDAARRHAWRRCNKVSVPVPVV